MTLAGQTVTRRLFGAMAAALVATPFVQRIARAAEELSELTVIVGGLDSREPGSPENSDVLMIARLNIPNLTLRVVSVPRDLYVLIPDFGYDKITRAHDFGSKADNGSFEGGAAVMTATVLENFGVQADAVILTTFDGFVDIVDALGGVTVDNPYDVFDAEYPTLDYGTTEIYFPTGSQQLDGENALVYCRTRHQDGDGGRILRQQLTIMGLLEQARKPTVAAKLAATVAQHASSVRTNLTTTQQAQLTAIAPTILSDRVTMLSLLPYVYGATTDSGMWIYSGDWSVIPGYVQGVLDGSITE